MSAFRCLFREVGASLFAACGKRLDRGFDVLEFRLRNIFHQSFNGQWFSRNRQISVMDRNMKLNVLMQIARQFVLESLVLSMYFYVVGRPQNCSDTWTNRSGNPDFRFSARPKLRIRASHLRPRDVPQIFPESALLCHEGRSAPPSQSRERSGRCLHNILSLLAGSNLFRAD